MPVEKRPFVDQAAPSGSACPACGCTFRGAVRHLRERADASISKQERGEPLLAGISWGRLADEPPRLDRELSQGLCEAWNRRFVEGTPTRFFRTWGRWGDFHDSKSRSSAFLSSSGEPVIFVEGVAGYVSLYHVEPQATEQVNG